MVYIGKKIAWKNLAYLQKIPRKAILESKNCSLLNYQKLCLYGAKLDPYHRKYIPRLLLENIVDNISQESLGRGVFIYPPWLHFNYRRILFPGDTRENARQFFNHYKIYIFGMEVWTAGIPDDTVIFYPLNQEADTSLGYPFLRFPEQETWDLHSTKVMYNIPKKRLIA